MYRVSRARRVRGAMIRKYAAICNGEEERTLDHDLKERVCSWRRYALVNREVAMCFLFVVARKYPNRLGREERGRGEHHSTNRKRFFVSITFLVAVASCVSS